MHAFGANSILLTGSIRERVVFARVRYIYPDGKNHYFFFKFAGAKSAQDFNFPEEIYAKGFCEQWEVVECIKNLKELTRLYDH